MSSWMNDAAVQNHNGAGFLDPNAGGAMLDPSAFMSNPASFDPSQFQNQQLQQRMQNGGMRNGSPAFNAPVYQTNSVIPSKRPRPREDSLGTSPRQAPGMLPNSRSQTPQQGPYPGFQQNNVPQQHAPQQNPYSHLQNGSANASPSPIMGNQLRPGGVPQRVSTASPHPFSPAAQQFPQASPSQSDHGGRVDTPQNANPYAQNPGFPQNFNQNFTPPPNRTSAPPQAGMPTPQMQPSHMQQSSMYPQQGQQPQQAQQRPQTLEQQKLLYQMQLQQQLQQRNMMAGRGNIPPNANPMAAVSMQGANGQFAGMRPQQAAQQARSGMHNPESFLKSLANFMQQRNMPLIMDPIVGDRKIALYTLYFTVSKFGGHKQVTARNLWPQVAQAMQFHPMQNQTAPQQLKTHYEQYLALFEEAFQLSQQQRARQAMMQQNPNMPGPQMSPTKQMGPQVAMQQSQNYMQQQQLMGQQRHLQQQHPQTTPVKQMAAMHQPQQPAVNGFSTPQQPQGQSLSVGAQGHARNNLSRSIDATPPQNGTSFTVPSPMSATKAGSLSLPSPQVDATVRTGAPPAPQEYQLTAVLDPKVRVLDTFGGVELDSLALMGTRLTQFKPGVPKENDLGVIDIHALTMSLQCGIHAEVRMALDTLTNLSIDPRVQVDLRGCEDLVECLVDCAESQVELLAENAAEVSDVMLVNSYEDIIRGCRWEQDVLQEIPAFGSLEYELDRAVDKLICITTIMRNLSFYESNHSSLADELVIKFLCIVIRYLGTRNMLLRTNQNTLDFMKDVIIFLSNLSQAIELPGREQALCLLHFLLAFAPCPPPNSNSERVIFSPYDPAVHRYLPSAVDSLAKLLARDEPNRTHYKTIFASDVASSPPFDILTRTFALAISPIPDDKSDVKRGNLAPVVEARKPFLMQGMLAAEILSNLAPGYESGLAKSWLTSEDGFSQNLTRLVLSLCLETTPQIPHSRASAVPKGIEDEALLHIAMGGMAVLRRLAEKSRDPEDPKSIIPIPGLPAKENLLSALEMRQPKLQGVLKQLCAYAGLGT